MLRLRVATATIAVVFGVVLLFSAIFAARGRPKDVVDPTPDRLSRALRLNGTYPANGGLRPYTVHHIPLGFSLMFGAGTLSGLLGIGSGAFKVLAMDQAMRIPFKVSTTTSNFMIGVTAAASAGIYLSRGYVDPGIAMPVMLGVLAGSMLGARVLVRTQTRWLRWVFSAVVVVLALEMIYNGFRGTI